MIVVTWMKVFFAPLKPDEGDGEIIDWVEEDEDSGYMTPPADTQPPTGPPLPCTASWTHASFHQSLADEYGMHHKSHWLL